MKDTNVHLTTFIFFVFNFSRYTSKKEEVTNIHFKYCLYPTDLSTLEVPEMPNFQYLCIRFSFARATEG